MNAVQMLAFVSFSSTLVMQRGVKPLAKLMFAVVILIAIPAGVLEL